MKWDMNLVPNLKNKVAIVTGGNTGLGQYSVQELARNNAQVVIACRSRKKGQQAINEIKSTLGNNVLIDVIEIDLSDYSSIHTFAKLFKQKYNSLDILMNNAGIVNQKEKSITKDGNEAQMGVNHFGHFLLTGLLSDLLINTPLSRVVILSSGAYKNAKIDFDDLDWNKRPYHRVKSYGDSKLANLLFAMNLQQYFQSKGTDTIVASAHPGLSASPRQQAIGIGGKLSKWMASPLSRGSRSQVLAATADFVKPLDFYGPKFGIDGPPVKQKIKHSQYTKAIADKLWILSEKVTNFKYQ